MPSPFPGMNPYFERPGALEDLHGLLIVVLRGLLTRGLPDGYFAKLGQLTFIQEPRIEDRTPLRQRRPDIYPVILGDGAGGTCTVPPPSLTGEIITDLPEERHRYIEVRRIEDGEAGPPVTVIQLLGPSNKRGGSGFGVYLAERHELLNAGVSLVEIDLLRGRGRMPMDPVPDCDYCVAVARAHLRPRVDIWTWGLRDPMPPVPVPLLPDDGDVALDLQSALHRAHDEGGYARWLYTLLPSNPIDPPLSAEDRAWAEHLVTAG